MGSTTNATRNFVPYAVLYAVAVLAACTWGTYDGSFDGGANESSDGSYDGGSDAGGDGGGSAIVVLTKSFGDNGGGVFPIITDGQNLYGVEFGTGVLSFPLAGGMVATLVTGNASNVLATDGAYVYFEVNLDVMRIPTSGGQISAVSDLPNTLGTGLFATDGTNVYFTNWSSGFADGGSVETYTVDVGSVPVAGGSATTLGSKEYSFVPCGAGNGTTAIASDGHNVYWMDGTCLPDGAPGYVLNAIPVDGGTVATLGAPASRSDLVAGIYSTSPPMVTDGKSVYWLEYVPNSDGGTVSGAVPPGGTVRIRAVPVGGGPVRKVASSPSSVAPLSPPGSVAPSPGLATDGIHIYWVAGGIQRVSVDGGAVTTLVSMSDLQALGFNAGGSVSPDGIAVDAKSVYWITGNVLMEKAK